MEYKEIVAVTGLGGLYQLLASKSDGAIVKSLSDLSTKFISARKHQVTPLESIEIYTVGENVRLHEVLTELKSVDDKTGLIEASASNTEIKNFFKTTYPEIDEERVYVSDMKKMLKWYQLLKSNDLLNFQAETPAEVQAEAPAEVKEEPAKKKAPKAAKTEEKTTPKKATKKAAKSTTEKPAAKKAAAKKKSED